jgi:hypothetical protein
MGDQFPPLKGELEVVLALASGSGKIPPNSPSPMVNPFSSDFLKEMNHSQKSHFSG